MADEYLDSKIPPKRDMIGYGRAGKAVTWPNGAKIAVSFVVNFEEGGERTLVNGDTESEVFITEGLSKTPRQGERDLNVESEFEYGTRAGFWRLFRLFEDADMRFTTFSVGRALEQVPEISQALVEKGHEVASHAYRWEDHHGLSAAMEEERVRKQLEVLRDMHPDGQAPVGWYIGRTSLNSRAIVARVYEELGLEFLWDSDTYCDDLPYWRPNPVDHDKGLVMLPYSLDCNDFKLTSPYFFAPKDFEAYMRDTFDYLYQEGARGRPKMMTIGLHNRVIGRPGRMMALARFVEYIAKKSDVWVATREEIARYWTKTYPYELEKEVAMERLGL